MRSPYLTALSHPLNLAMLWLALFAGLLAAWWLLPIGLVVWAIMVGSIARDPLLRMNYAMKSRAPLAARFQEHFDRLERAQVGIFNAVASAPPNVQRALRSIQPEVNQLISQVHHLCERMTALENYRAVAQSTLDLEDVTQSDQSPEIVKDPLVQREMEDARLAREGHLKNLEAISIQLERVEAQLVSVRNEMDQILAEIVQAQALGARQASRRAPDLAHRLREQAKELRDFERQLDRLDLD